MQNIRRRNGQIKATYNNVEYVFNSIIEFMIALSTLSNVNTYYSNQAKQN